MQEFCLKYLGVVLWFMSFYRVEEGVWGIQEFFFSEWLVVAWGCRSFYFVRRGDWCIHELC